MKKLLILPALFISTNCALLSARSPASHKSFVIHSHRGAPEYPENMMSAFQYAALQGADVIEMDVQITKDDKIIVAHDAYMKEECATRAGVPVTPKGVFYRDLKWSQVEEYDCGTRTQGPVTAVPGEGISSLEHVLESLRRVTTKKGKPIGFNIEIKYNPSQPQFYPLRPFYAKHVMNVIAESGIEESRILIQSFDVGILEEVRKLNPTVRLSPLIGDDYAMSRAVGYVRDLKTDLITPHHGLVNRDVVAAFHKIGVQVIPWTVNDEKTKKLMRDAGVDGVITDKIELFNSPKRP